MNEPDRKKLVLYFYNAIIRMAFPEVRRSYCSTVKYKTQMSFYQLLINQSEPGKHRAAVRKSQGYKGVYRKHPSLKGLASTDQVGYKKLLYRMNTNEIKARSKKFYEENKTNVLVRQKRARYGSFLDIANKTAALHKEILCREKQLQEKR